MAQSIGCWRWFNAILEILFPTCCVVCGNKLLQEEQVLCSSCLASIARTEHAILPDNGIDMLFAEVIKTFGKRIHYYKGGAWGYYNRERGQILRSLIERGKYGARPQAEVFAYLGEVAAREYIDSDLFDDIDVLVPVPLHPRRLRERGFNQAEWICRGMSKILGIPVDTEHLYRVRNNPHQAQSRFDKRLANTQNLFAVRYPEEWKDKHILLVDDVITSGATMLSCMHQLTPIRGCKASVFALGWAHN
jgi:ComF family protein